MSINWTSASATQINNVEFTESQNSCELTDLWIQFTVSVESTDTNYEINSNASERGGVHTFRIYDSDRIEFSDNNNVEYNVLTNITGKIVVNVNSAHRFSNAV